MISHHFFDGCHIGGIIGSQVALLCIDIHVHAKVLVNQ